MSLTYSYEDFRGTAELRAAVREFLTSDVGRIMLRVMRARYKPCDVPSQSDAIASARVLSQFHGAHLCLDDLEALCDPPKLDINLEPNFRASETDHERMPNNTTPQIVANFLPTQEQTDAHQ